MGGDALMLDGTYNRNLCTYLPLPLIGMLVQKHRFKSLFPYLCCILLFGETLLGPLYINNGPLLSPINLYRIYKIQDTWKWEINFILENCCPILVGVFSKPLLHSFCLLIFSIIWLFSIKSVEALWVVMGCPCPHTYLTQVTIHNLPVASWANYCTNP